MSADDSAPGDAFVVAPKPEPAESISAGGTRLDTTKRRLMRQHGVANPDDPPTPPPLRDRSGRAAPDSYFLGRMAIVQGQVYIVGVILVVQLWLVTTALWELLSGRPHSIWGLTIASGIGFIIALIVFLWPRRRAKGQ